MTPREVRALSIPEYLAMLRHMDEERRELAPAAAEAWPIGHRSTPARSIRHILAS